jgi:hypothetical protein
MAVQAMVRQQIPHLVTTSVSLQVLLMHHQRVHS